MIPARCKYSQCLFVILVLAFFATSCTVNGLSEDPKDPYALWREQSNEKIVFMSKADTPEGELYLLEKSGKITRLTHNTRHENNPALSFDGSKVAFNGGDEHDQLTWEIYVLDLATGEKRQLTSNNLIDAHPDWSPGGTKIVFGSFRDAEGNPSGAADIYLINVDGGGLEQLTDSPWEDNDPEWSPDGTRIAFKSTRNTQQSGREEIYVMDSDGSNPQRLTTTSDWQSDHDPSWSPDSDSIVFTRFEGSRIWFDTVYFVEDWQELTPWNVYRVDLDCNVQRLTNLDTAGWGVVLWSADGSRILYGRIDWILDGNYQVIGGDHLLILIDPDGSNPQQLLPEDEHTGTLEYFDW